MKDIYYRLIYPYQKSIRLKNLILQNIIVNHLIKLVRKYVWEIADFYFNENGKPDLYYILRRIFPFIKKDNSSIIFIQCTEMTWKTPDTN